MVLRPPGLGCNNSIRLSIYFNNIFRKSLYKWLYKFQVIDEKFIVLVLDSEQDKELAASSLIGKLCCYMIKKNIWILDSLEADAYNCFQLCFHNNLEY